MMTWNMGNISPHFHGHVNHSSQWWKDSSMKQTREIFSHKMLDSSHSVKGIFYEMFIRYLHSNDTEENLLKMSEFNFIYSHCEDVSEV